MKQDFWLARWKRNEIGFHQADGQPLLREHWSELALADTARVLVPLCGKTRDMAWLAARGHRVTGIELSHEAAQAFFTESNTTPHIEHTHGFDYYRAGNIEIAVGDLFDFPARELAVFDAVYDRAALIALPPAMRERYADYLSEHLAPGTASLLITFEYPQQEMDGPPFCVEPKEVKHLFARHWAVAELASRDGEPEMEHLRRKGLSQTRDRVYRLTRQ